MKLYTCTTFEGFWPVGAAAVVLANSRREAWTLLDAALKAKGLPGLVSEETPKHRKDVLVQVLQGQPKAIILVDGNY